METIEDPKVCPFSMSNANAIRDCAKENCMAWGEVPTGNGVGCRLIP